MDMTGEFHIPAPRDTVWKALNDPEILKRSIAGCEELEKTSDTEFTAKVTAKVGPVKARFTGKVTLSDLDPPNGYKITGEGQGGAAGFAKGSAEVHLEPEGDGTLLKYVVHAAIGGKLAQIGARLIDGAANKMAGEFFSSFASNVVGSLPTTASAEAAPTAATPADAAPAAGPAVSRPVTANALAPSRGLPPWVWVGGLIVIAIVLLLYFGR
ncbi:MAG TPA: carbon monoxide dehydrogenase subunit G [Verrucomicrobiae bacterium]|nr:carbon monoxide dehydrogenase subunit G [Verrucomicrobiae bacterium]